MMTKTDRTPKLSPRLGALLQLIRPGARLLDVGSDHAYLPVAAVAAGVAKAALASDIASGPIERARAHVAEYGLEDRVETMRTPGLEGTEDFHATDVVIAGMGGEMIASILEACRYIRDPRIRLILQPMTKSEKLREYLSHSGFEIDGETVIEEGRRIYEAMTAHYTGIPYLLSPLEAQIGRRDPGNDGEKTKKLLEKKIARQRKAAQGKRADDPEKEKEVRLLTVLTSALEALELKSKKNERGGRRMTVGELYELLDARYPRSLSCPWDNDGRMVVPDGSREVKKALCCLDVDMETVKQALLFGADVILSHHPLIFKPVKALDHEDPTVAKAMLLYKSGISVLSFHTRLDCGKGGVNDVLAEETGLTNIREWTIDGLPMGRLGDLGAPCDGRTFAAAVKEALGCETVRMVNPEKTVSTVAVIGGSGGSYFKDAIAAGADALLTGEASHHQLLDAGEAGLCLIAAGHDYTERMIAGKLALILRELDDSIETRVLDKIRIPTL